MAAEAKPGTKSSTQTVAFDVGGKIFKVLYSPTLELHPTSLLKQLADDRDGDEPIFVEANPDLFPYLLDFHRNRKVYIPHTVSKAGIVHEAKKLGLNLKVTDIMQDSAPLAEQVSTMNQTIARKKEELSQDQKKIQKKLDLHRCEMLTNILSFCFLEQVAGSQEKITISWKSVVESRFVAERLENEDEKIKYRQKPFWSKQRLEALMTQMPTELSLKDIAESHSYSCEVFYASCGEIGAYADFHRAEFTPKLPLT